MGFSGHFATVLLAVATILMVLASVTSPVVKSFGFLKMTIEQVPRIELYFGAFGDCSKEGEAWKCMDPAIGYNLYRTLVLAGLDPTRVDLGLNDITRGFVIHPIAAILSFIAFIISAASNKFGFIFATAMATLSFLATLIALILDFVAFQRVRQLLLKSSVEYTTTAAWGPAMWIVVVSFVCLFLAQFFTLFQCCCGRTRSQKKEQRNKEAYPHYHGHA